MPNQKLYIELLGYETIFGIFYSISEAFIENLNSTRAGVVSS